MPKQSQGLGDSIEKAIPKKVKKAIEKAFPDCGCQERKNKLNAMFPYNSVKNCMTEEQYVLYEDYRERDPRKITEADQELILDMYNSVFQTNIKGCPNCAGAVWKGYIQRLDKVYLNYNNKKD